MASVPTVDQQYWRAYMMAITQQLGQPGKDEVVFVAPPTERGIAGGPWIPAEVTNNLLYNVADVLPPSDSPLYVPGGDATYIGMLKQYLNWVEVSSNTNPGALIRLTDAQNRMNTAGANLDYENTQLLQRYQRDPFHGDYTMQDWARSNAQSYTLAKSQYDAAAGAYRQAMNDVYGPDAAQVNNYIQRLEDATNILTSVPGYNMGCTLMDLNNIEALYKQANHDPTGGSPATAKEQFRRPAYSLQGYSSTVDSWVKNFGKNVTTLKINLEDGRNSRWEDLGFSRVNASASVGFWWVFSTTVKVSSETKTKHLQLDESKSQVSAELVVNGLAKLPIGAGAWDVPGVKTMFPNLREGHPDGLSSALVRPESLLLGYGVGLNVTFSSEIVNQVHDMFEEAKKVGGSCRIFGFDIAAGGGGSSEKSRSVTFDQVSWDKQSGTLAIKAEDNGYPTLLGMVGRRL